MLILARDQIEELLDLDELVDSLAGAMSDLSSGKASMPPRIAVQVPEVNGFLGVMPSLVGSQGALATKLVSLFPRNRDRPTHQAVIVCFDPDTGTPTALLDGTYITGARTAAGSALATRLLARDDARTVAILGTGVQARSHARAVVRVRSIENVLVAGRDEGRAHALARELGRELDASVEAAGGFEQACAAADIVCATTHSPEPVVRREWLRPGVHVNSVGYNTDGREVDGETVAAALVVVETRDSALAPPPAGSNDLTWPIRDGLVGEDYVHGEIGELVAGTVEGRTSDDQITLYKSVGAAVQDAAAAALVLRAAVERGVGTDLEI